MARRGGRKGWNVQERPGDGRTILVVDDEAEVRALIAATLRSDGWTVVEAADADEALAVVAAADLAAVTLDIALGRASGYDVCRAIRATSDVPVLFLTARAQEFDEVLGFELGADDYLVKPFSPRILSARVAAVVRRRAVEGPAGHVLHAGLLSLDERSRRTYAGEHEVVLTKTEFELLAALMRSPDRAFDRDTLLDRVWGDWYSDAHVVDVTVARLRRKLADAGLPTVIDTIRGVGYRLAAPVRESAAAS